MKSNLLKTSLIFLTAAVASCGFDVTKIHPHFLDTERGYARVYKANKIKVNKCGDPDYKFVDTGERKPIDDMDGYIAIPVSEAQEIIKHYDESERKKCANDVQPETQTLWPADIRI